MKRPSQDLDEVQKKNMYRIVPILLLITCLTLSCTPYVKYTPCNNISDLQSPYLPPGDNTIPSGKKIYVNNVSKMDFDIGPSALVLSYRTSTSIDQMSELRAEVHEVWSLFVKDVEAAGLNAAALRPEDKDGRGYGFTFEKHSDGTWQLDDDTKK